MTLLRIFELCIFPFATCDVCGVWLDQRLVYDFIMGCRGIPSDAAVGFNAECNLRVCSDLLIPTWLKIRSCSLRCWSVKPPNVVPCPVTCSTGNPWHLSTNVTLSTVVFEVSQWRQFILQFRSSVSEYLFLVFFFFCPFLIWCWCVGETRNLVA